jgi:hypothetical protein
MAVDLSRGKDESVVEAVTEETASQSGHKPAGAHGDLKVNGVDSV